LGFNSYDFKVDTALPGKISLLKAQPVLMLVLVVDLRLHEYINLRFEPGLYYTQKL
jgi:hypothetical protein